MFEDAGAGAEVLFLLDHAHDTEHELEVLVFGAAAAATTASSAPAVLVALELLGPFAELVGPLAGGVGMGERNNGINIGASAGREVVSSAAGQVAYVGDDLIDWPVMAEIGLSVAVADAHPLLIPRADYVTHINGGRGAVREVCDLLLLAQGKLDEAKGQSI